MTRDLAKQAVSEMAHHYREAIVADALYEEYVAAYQLARDWEIAAAVNEWMVKYEGWAELPEAETIAKLIAEENARASAPPFRPLPRQALSGALESISQAKPRPGESEEGERELARGQELLRRFVEGGGDYRSRGRMSQADYDELVALHAKWKAQRKQRG